MDQDDLDLRENALPSPVHGDGESALQDTSPPGEALKLDESVASDLDGEAIPALADAETTSAEALPPPGAEEVAPVRPREIIRGIHPELLCACEECEPEHVELQWFNVDEQKKIKGTAMLFCGYSSRKYFTPVPDLQAFLTANPVKPAPRKSAAAST